MKKISEDDAQKIVALFAKHTALTERLREIERVRETGTGLDITFNVKNPRYHYGEEVGLRHKASFPGGKIDDLAATILARLSEQIAMKRRLIEHELRELGAAVAVTTA